MNIITKYFELSSAQDRKFAALKEIYSEWNKKINVISRKDIDNIYEHHVLHSLAIAKVIQFKKNTSIMDAGTGGGFPGIPLAILFEDCSFVLVDSIGKKIKVVEAVATELGLKNVRTLNSRAEQVNEKFDFIVSRAVTELPVFVSWMKNKIKKEEINNISNGLLYLKGGDVKVEIKNINCKFNIYEINSFFEEEYFQSKKLIHIF